VNQQLGVMGPLATPADSPLLRECSFIYSGPTQGETGNESVFHHQIEGLRRLQPPIMMMRRRGRGEGNFDRKTRIAQLTRDCDTYRHGLGAPPPMGIHMSRSYYGVSGFGLRPQMGIVRIVMCVRVREKENKNDVIGCEYGHLRLIDLCIAIGVREKGKGKKKN
jgi:hypothetical protein